MKLKELLQKRKAGFVKYAIGSLIPIFNNIVFSISFAALIGYINKEVNIEQLTLLGIVVVVIGPLSQIVSRFLRIGYMRDILLDVRKLAFKKILDQDYQNFARKSRDVYISNLVNDINLFEQDFFLSLLNIIVNIGVFLVVFIYLFLVDIPVALITLLGMGLMVLVTKLFEEKIINLRKETSALNERYSVDASNTISGLEILKLNHVETLFQKKFIQRVEAVEDKKKAFTLITFFQSRIHETIATVFNTLAMVLVAFYILNYNMSVTTATLIIQFHGMIIWHLVYLFQIINRFKASVKIYDKICLPEASTTIDPGHLPFKFEDEIRFSNVSFGYDPSKPILKDVNMVIEKGKRYLLKGPSGTGKTTLLQLFSKVYKPDQGKIMYDQQNLNDINTQELNRQIAFVYQNVFLFNDSIRNNITLFQDVPEEQLEAAVLQAGLADFIQQLPEGLDTILEENGKNISGGQRQRISIARALVKNSSILFIDEATSSLDAELGANIEQTILNLDKTIVAISHRYYENITDQYDGVLQIVNQRIKQTTPQEYFQLEEGDQ